MSPRLVGMQSPGLHPGPTEPAAPGGRGVLSRPHQELEPASGTGDKGPSPSLSRQDPGLPPGPPCGRQDYQHDQGDPGCHTRQEAVENILHLARYPAPGEARPPLPAAHRSCALSEPCQQRDGALCSLSHGPRAPPCRGASTPERLRLHARSVPGRAQRLLLPLV